MAYLNFKKLLIVEDSFNYDELKSRQRELLRLINDGIDVDINLPEYDKIHRVIKAHNRICYLNNKSRINE